MMALHSGFDVSIFSDIADMVLAAQSSRPNVVKKSTVRIRNCCWDVCRPTSIKTKVRCVSRIRSN